MENPISYLSHIMEEHRSPNFPNKPKLTGGLIGYFAYDTVRYMEQTVSSSPEDDLDMPDCHLFLYDEIVAFDHLSNKVVIILNISQKETLRCNMKRAKNVLTKSRKSFAAISPYQSRVVRKRYYSYIQCNGSRIY